MSAMPYIDDHSLKEDYAADRLDWLLFHGPYVHGYSREALSVNSAMECRE